MEYNGLFGFNYDECIIRHSGNLELRMTTLNRRIFSSSGKLYRVSILDVPGVYCTVCGCTQHSGHVRWGMYRVHVSDERAKELGSSVFKLDYVYTLYDVESCEQNLIPT